MFSFIDIWVGKSDNVSFLSKDKKRRLKDKTKSEKTFNERGNDNYFYNNTGLGHGNRL
jgi:hypothetical protein